jgi:radical SAM protein with 4Fe4S-binding SPASM domain
LAWNGGGAFSTGVGIGCVDAAGNVHPDQFWQDYHLGNVRSRTFADIWSDESDALMHGLKHKAEYLKGRCRLCRHRSLCTGSMRVRALRVYADPWAPDPQCYLSDQEIGLTPDDLQELIRSGEAYHLSDERMYQHEPVSNPD